MGNIRSKESKGKKLRKRDSYVYKDDYRRPLIQFVHFSEQILGDEREKPPKWVKELVRNLNLSEKSLANAIHRGGYKDVFVFDNAVYSFQIIKQPIEKKTVEILSDRIGGSCRYVFPQHVWFSPIVGKRYYNPTGKGGRDTDWILRFMVGKMETCVEGDMWDYVYERWRYNEPLDDLRFNVIYMMHDLIESMLMLHSQQIFLLDIKPENIIGCKPCAEDGQEVGKRTIQWKFTDLDPSFIYDRYKMDNGEQFRWIRTLPYIPTFERPHHRVELKRNDAFALMKTFMFYITFVFSDTKVANSIKIINTAEFNYMRDKGLTDARRMRDLALLKNNDFGKKFQSLMEKIESLYYLCLNYRADKVNDRYITSRTINSELTSMKFECKAYIKKFNSTGKWGDEVDNSPSRKYKRLIKRTAPIPLRTKSSVKFKF